MGAPWRGRGKAKGAVVKHSRSERTVKSVITGFGAFAAISTTSMLFGIDIDTIMSVMLGSSLLLYGVQASTEEEKQELLRVKEEVEHVATLQVNCSHDSKRTVVYAAES
jgi:flagellar basal body-associated protein FliL